tara:strand:+ start:49 stop:561 length:513 start_codon:yes stop_codon:yes gene_type:complete
MANTFRVKTKANVSNLDFNKIYTTPESTTTVILGMTLTNKSLNVVKVTVKLGSVTIDEIRDRFEYTNNGDGVGTDNLILEPDTLLFGELPNVNDANDVTGSETNDFLLMETSKREQNEPVSLLHDVPIPSGSSLEMFAGQKLNLQQRDTILVKCDTGESLDFALSILEIS